jgi:hypothetical protein
MALFLFLLAGMIARLYAADATASKRTIIGGFPRLLKSEDAASPDPAVQIIPMEATAVADLHAEWRRLFFDVAAERLLADGEICGRSLQAEPRAWLASFGSSA